MALQVLVKFVIEKTKMVLKCYFDLISQPSRAVYLFLKINNIPFQACPIALRKGEQRSVEYEKINPAKQVPAIDHNGFKLRESIGILRYLSREFNVSNHWYPKDSKGQAKVDEFLEWQHNTLRLHGTLVFIHRVRDPLFTKKQVDQAKLDRSRNDLEKELDVMEKLFLKDTPFLNRNEISVADLIGACEIETPIASGENILDNRPVLSSWLERVRSQTQPYYAEAHAILDKMNLKVVNKEV